MEQIAFSVGGRTVTAPAGLPKPGTENTIISNALTIFITAGIIITVIMVIYAGIKWVTSGGDKQKLASARARLTWAIIGLVIILVSFFIISIFSYVFNVNLLNFKLE